MIIFEYEAEIEDGSHYRTSESNDELRSSEYEHGFRIITNVGHVEATCVECAERVRGVAWGGPRWVLCNRCAILEYGAEDLQRVHPELFTIANSEGTVRPQEPMPTVPVNGTLRTRRDRDFIPESYHEYTHSQDLTGVVGCSGFRCTTTDPEKHTLVKNTKFMMGSGSIGCLCMTCYKLYKEAYEAMPKRIRCPCCERMVTESATFETCYEGKVCRNCQTYFYHCPVTDGGWVRRNELVHLIGTGELSSAEANRLGYYASRRWANTHWFHGHGDNWYRDRASADRELMSIDIMYRDRRIAENRHQPVFQYGTNIIKMLGFPANITPSDSLCFGVELEMVPKQGSYQENIVEALGGKYANGRPYILAADSSLGDGGVELITLPYSLKDHKADKHIQWTKLLEPLKTVAKSGAGTTRCGMHIHINRRALSPLQMGKMLLIINTVTMQDFICYIAQRGDSGYSHRKVVKVSDGRGLSPDHYDALNVATNKGTCELRIFRGNLRYERVMKNLEFADALCTYASEQSIQKLGDPKLMIGWIADNKAHYPHLHKFLGEGYKAKRRNWKEETAYDLAQRIRVKETDLCV